LPSFKESSDAATDSHLSAHTPVASATRSAGRNEFASDSGHMPGTAYCHSLLGIELTPKADGVQGAFTLKSDKEGLNYHDDRNVAADAAYMMKQVALPLNNNQGHSDKGKTAELCLHESCQVDPSQVSSTGVTRRTVSTILGEDETSKWDLNGTPALNQGNSIGDYGANAEGQFITASRTTVDHFMTVAKDSAVVITPAAMTGTCHRRDDRYLPQKR
jgi:hypothetical protein